MINHLEKIRHQLFECDTWDITGSIYIHFYFNIVTKWEVVGLLFLSTETKTNIEKGLEYVYKCHKLIVFVCVLVG